MAKKMKPLYPMSPAESCWWDVTIRTEVQKRVLGEFMAKAMSESREFELRQEKQSVLVLMGPADDLGHVYKIGPSGGVRDIGITEGLVQWPS